MTEKDKRLSDELLEELKAQGVQFINVPNFKDIANLEEVDDITLFAHLAPLMTGIAEALGHPAPSHKEIKDALVKARELSKLQSTKEK